MNQSVREQLRQSLRQQRNALDSTTARQLSAEICQRLNPLLLDASHVAGYLALGKEVDLHDLQESSETRGFIYYVPIVQPQFRLLFAPVSENTRFTQNHYGILEPQTPASQLAQASALDVVLVPLVGFDEQCNRMGMGGGYYDRCFEHGNKARTRPLLIGVAYEFQQAQTVYPEHWDVPLDMIVTPSRTFSRNT